VSRLDLRRRDGAPPLVVGHRGAAALAPENSLEGLEAALRLGVDFVELDVRGTEDGTLQLAHTAVRPGQPTLAAALERLTATRTGLLLDLKERDIEDACVRELRRFGFVERTLACTVHAGSLRRLAAIEPLLARSLSYPDDRLGIGRRPALAPVVRAGLAAGRRTLPARASRWVSRLGTRALTLHWALVTPRLVERCHDAGAAVIAWTLPDAEVARTLEETGVDGMIADDPRFLMDAFPR